MRLPSAVCSGSMRTPTPSGPTRSRITTPASPTRSRCVSSPTRTGMLIGGAKRCCSTTPARSGAPSCRAPAVLSPSAPASSMRRGRWPALPPPRRASPRCPYLASRPSRCRNAVACNYPGRSHAIRRDHALPPSDDDRRLAHRLVRSHNYRPYRACPRALRYPDVPHRALPRPGRPRRA